eukprot:CAMPEP_0170491576 /NCGR_PEP_ID=MMETSP0208-20121228/11129_1 /TAXON_ID=197538 /ORGANISM="Strombidium inclinatum, Strain S3" /LENGTH=73 /DNA_ID=CAMNT_0010767171 /DNA_START=159 /DNA_END=380 /DNA_ORIENTATION=+
MAHQVGGSCNTRLATAVIVEGLSIRLHAHLVRGFSDALLPGDGMIESVELLLDFFFGDLVLVIDHENNNEEDD